MEFTLTLNELDLAADFALDLANTYDPMRDPVDILARPESAETFLRPYLHAGESAAPVAQNLTGFRDNLRAALKSMAAGRRPAPRIAADLDSALGVTWRVRVGRTGKLAVLPREGVAAASRIRALASVGTLALLQDASERLRVCRSAPCEEVFRDRTRSGRQRFCSKRCATRVNVAHYRSRLKT